MQRFDFVNRANADYIDRLYEQYKRDPRSLDEEWRAYFAGFEFAAANANANANANAARTAAGVSRATGDGEVAGTGEESLSVGVYDLVHSYRELGHFLAHLDPLGHNRPSHPLLELSEFGLSPTDLDKRVGPGPFLGPTDGSLRDLIEQLRATYCRTLGVEYMNISDKAQRDWLAQRMEPVRNRPEFSKEEQQAILFQLVAAEEFERFLHTRYVNQKRFSLEGAEALIPLLNTTVDDAAKLGVEEVCMGMAHRGRLNVLAHVLNKPYEILFSEFEGTIVNQDETGDGDVKYHLGYANDRPVPGHNTGIHLSLSPNPSHLELINPVVEGIVRCKQKIRGDKDHKKVVPLLIHGDAAFVGQGIVHETLGLSELSFYRTGGTVHVIVNNQIGFTTTPREGRFTPYPTDVAKMIQAPIFHVNGDDPEAVVWASRLAIAFREEFRCDVMLDLWCYRRHGHNETDEPSFTQPVMYREIGEHRSVRELYQEKLLRDGRVSQAEVEEMRKVARERMEGAANLAREYRPRQRTAVMNKLWKGLVRASGEWNPRTGVARDVLTKVADAYAKLPAEFTPHPKLKKLTQSRADAVRAGKGIDWGTGEMLAMGSLLLEGHPIRFAGQDVQRGTFSHRHAVLYDYNSGEPYTPLNFLVPKQEAHLTIINTMLSELAVLGFEYGFSSADPRNLVLWEAQFGDFVNGAQPIIDQFIVAAESKWGLSNGMVMLLPHGFEGQGPEHSNAYLERWLSLCAEDNIQVCVPTTPANYFHLLRRQLARNFRKPLVCLMPKSLLRYEPSFSTTEQLTDGAVQMVIDDPSDPARDTVKRILFCSGKVYYTLAKAREDAKINGTALVRVEQLHPFPKREIQAVLAKYRQAREIGWVQEEPRNRGAWSFMEPRLRELLPDPAVLTYYGRDEAASPATGNYKMHQIEEKEILTHALELPTKEPAKPGEPVAVAANGNGSNGATTAAAASAASQVPATAKSPTSASD
jgi:2-oxoglutarate dehydrogenase E1 component